MNMCELSLYICCVTDGQTGSGKTYTMFGEEGEIRGMIPRSVEYLFDILAKRSATNEVCNLISIVKLSCE